MGGCNTERWLDGKEEEEAASKTSNRRPRVRRASFSVNVPGSLNPVVQVTFLILCTIGRKTLPEAEAGMCCGRSNFGICLSRAGLRRKLRAREQCMDSYRKVSMDRFYLRRRICPNHSACCPTVDKARRSTSQASYLC